MKKTLLTSIGVLIILLVVGVWGYLFVFGPEGGKDIFSNLGFNGEQTREEAQETPSGVDALGSGSAEVLRALRQLTTRPVAGATFIEGGIRYAERGTGHIYDIMFSTGAETQVSVTTIPRTIGTTFSEDGTSALMTYESEGGSFTLLGSLTRDDAGTGVLETTNLPEGAREAAFLTNDTIAYIEEAGNGVSGVRYDVTTGVQSSLFSLPLLDVRVVWGEKTYVYTKPSAHQVGYLYKIQGNVLEFVTNGKRGLMGTAFKNGLVISWVEGDTLSSSVVLSTTTISLPFSILPDKCVTIPQGEDALYCTAPLEKLSGAFPDLWYKGVATIDDTLWRIHARTGGVTPLSYLSSESGRAIDVSHIGTNGDGTLIYFINKNDGVLWMFDTTI